MPFLVEYTEEFLKKSWDWLNDSEIKALTLTPDFTKEEQYVFFKTLPERKNYWIQGIVEKAVPIGAMGLKNINNVDAEYWGYIGEKAYWGKGIGRFILDSAIHKANEIKLQKLFLNVSSKNERAKNLYLKYGFKYMEIKNGIEKHCIIL